ncbi:hypothetical protein ACWD6P_17370 [Streptomyces sp. NPDC002446]
MARVKFVIAGACGLLLAVGGASPAQAWDGFDGYGGDGVWNSDTIADFRAIIRCGPRAKLCVNGPVNSGNVKNAQNVYVKGNPNDSGSPTNTNGNTNDDAGGTTGVENQSSNKVQNIARSVGSTHF